jgi:hypothetical protein
MFSVPLLATAVLPIIPLAAEIDCGPLAGRVGTAFKFGIVVESAVGQRMEATDIGVTANAQLDDMVEVILLSLGGWEKKAMHRQGNFVTMTELNGFPVRKLTFKFNDAGPKPIVRWVPKRK